MAVTKDYIRSLLKGMKFKRKDGSKEIWEKVYKAHNNYSIQVDFELEDGKIIYQTAELDKCILVSNASTTNFKNDENFVVLECVDRLLEKGYEPNQIELEHTWPSGHGTSGRLDILVKKAGNSYLMIECKTYGKEYIKEKNNMLTADKNGESKGQLLAYCWEEKTTEFLCLYASILQDGQIKYENAIIPVEEGWKTLANKKELFNYWNKLFKKNGIFEQYITPYNIKCKALLRGDLDKLTDADSSRIFNQFLEILRHNAVSDKPNAFNKVLNLFICKIIDEDRNEDEELQFQWKDTSTYISLQSNLEELYKQGMNKFLDIEVTDYSDEDLENNLALLEDTKTKEVIRKMFQELRLQKNPEFAFKEVYNQESFEENAKVVKEVVELLQSYQFRYGHKQQFLGNFFEQLLNTSIKQESGQFFTPVPISRFMITSLPIKEVIDKNIMQNNRDILPSFVDYACGAGHFLTEYMDVVQSIINSYETKGLRSTTKNKLEKWKQSDDENELQGEFEWANDCVYGIEKDYRLVKTSKISTFLNGDGEANIIHADGLDKFSSEKYKGRLSSNSEHNNSFDFVIANPPYSVAAFKQTLPCNEADFDTYQYLTESSSEIECLFVERTNQLLKEGGCAAIILPSSLLTNTSSIYESTRDILIKNFYIKAIAKMGSNTFMATGTSTIILFLEKRNRMDAIKITKCINDFFTSFKDFTYNGMTNLISNYAATCIENTSFKEYVEFIKNKSSQKFRNTEYYIELDKAFKQSKEYKAVTKKKTFASLQEDKKNQIIDELFVKYYHLIEKNKILNYILTCEDKTLLINTGEKEAEKEFLGYWFTTRRGYEGIHYYMDENECINSALYDEEEINTNDKKVNYYIYNAFINKYHSIPAELKENVMWVNNVDLFDFNTPNFSNTIQTKNTSKPLIISKYPIKKLGEEDLIQLLDDKRVPVAKAARRKGQYPYYGATGIIDKIDDYIFDEKIVLIGEDGAKWDANENTSFIVEGKCWVNNHAHVLKVNEQELLPEYLVIMLNSYDLSYYINDASPKKLTQAKLLEIRIPVPPLDVQQKIIDEYKKINTELENKKNEIEGLLTSVRNFVENIYNKGYTERALGDSDICLLRRGPFGGALKKEIFVASGYKVYEQKHAMNNDFNIGRYYINEEKFKEMKEFEIIPNDIIMSCSSSKSTSVGNFAIAPADVKPGIINQALLRFRAQEKVLPEYLKLCLEHIAEEFQSKTHGMGIKNISSVDTLKILKIPVPDTLEEQEEILKTVRELNEKIEKANTANEEGVNKKEAMLAKYIQ